jgi:hypothetical protein
VADMGVTRSTYSFGGEITRKVETWKNDKETEDNVKYRTETGN